jgi:hypothetical protein
MLSVVLPLVLDHLLSPAYPVFEDAEQHFMVDPGENFSDDVQVVLSLSQL